LRKQLTSEYGKKTLVLDLDETLVHSAFKYVSGADIVMPIEIEGRNCEIFVNTRPGIY
jgi:RNA polymerase II subunit A small phosphatase-like protein